MRVLNRPNPSLNPKNKPFPEAPSENTFISEVILIYIFIKPLNRAGVGSIFLPNIFRFMRARVIVRPSDKHGLMPFEYGLWINGGSHITKNREKICEKCLLSFLLLISKVFLAGFAAEEDFAAVNNCLVTGQLTSLLRNFGFTHLTSYEIAHFFPFFFK